MTVDIAREAKGLAQLLNVMADDGEAADELAHGLDGWSDVDHRRVLGDEAVVAVALRLQEEVVLLLVDV